MMWPNIFIYLQEHFVAWQSDAGVILSGQIFKFNYHKEAEQKFKKYIRGKNQILSSICCKNSMTYTC